MTAYDISVAGHIAEPLLADLLGVEVHERFVVTVLRGDIESASALQTLLHRLSGRGLELVEVRQVAPGAAPDGARAVSDGEEVYDIQIRGDLGDAARAHLVDAVRGLEATETILRTRVADQAELCGILARLHELDCELMSACRARTVEPLAASSEPPTPA